MRRRENRLVHLLLCAALFFSLAGMCLAHSDDNALRGGRMVAVLDGSDLRSLDSPLLIDQAAAAATPSDLQVLNAWKGFVERLETYCEDEARQSRPLASLERAHRGDPPTDEYEQEEDMGERKNTPYSKRKASPLLNLR